MTETNFTTLYKGTEVKEAENSACENGTCAVIYCENGYGVTYMEEERIELTSNHAIALRWRGKSSGITLSEDFSGHFFICSGTLADLLFLHYTEGRSFYLSQIDGKSEKSSLFFNALGDSDDLHLFHTLLRILRTEEEPPTGKHGSASVKAIKEYIDSHLYKKITLELLSRHFFISKTQIHRLFVAQYGISPMKYMLKAKIEHSKELLTSTDTKISEIAERLCFTDSKHYTNTFRNFTGELPSEYRKTR